MAKTSNCLFLTVFVVFAIMSLWKLHPFQFPLSEAIYGFDDWHHYAQHAMDIRTNGLLIPSVQDTYLAPAGFLYNYFVALFLWLGNDNLWLVYLLQGLMVPTSVCLVYRVFSPYMRPVTGYILLVFLSVIGFLDVFRHYSFLLLSENLLLLTMPFSFLFLQQYETHRKPGKMMLSVLFLALSVLIRPNIFPFSILMMIIIVVVLYRVSIQQVIVALLVYGVVFSLLAIRNYLVTGEVVFLPVNGSFVDYMGRVNVQSPLAEPFSFLMYYVKQVLFMLGFLPVVEPAYSFRPHWWLLWFGVFVMLFYVIRGRIKPGLTVWSMLLYIAVFYGVLVLIAPVYVYGFRMVTPALFFVTGFAFIGFEQLWISQNSRDRSSGTGQALSLRKL